MATLQISTILGILGDSLYARDDQQRLYATSLAAIPTPDLTELEIPEDQQDLKVKWTVRRKLTHALLRPHTLKWERQPEWSDEEMADAQLRADSLKRYGW